MRVSFYTLGCKVNQYETQAMKEQFAAAGFTVVEDGKNADVFVINSCTVTATGDQKTRNRIHRFRRENPDALVVLTGCFPQAFPEKAKAMEEIDIVAGANIKTQIIDMVLQALSEKNKLFSVSDYGKSDPFEKMNISSFSEKTRAFVKIEDGCDQFCTYCIIPYARGRVRSKSLEDITAELSVLAQNGYKEVVLVGINLSSYGKDTGYKLRDAVAAACSVEGIERVRLGSLEPELLTPEDIKAMAESEKFCPQFHLAVQSGCDTVLKRMNRHYDTAIFSDIVNQIFNSFDNPSITTDIIVGFPGETEEEFEQTLNFAKKINFARIHSFPYSSREGTRAAKMGGQLTKKQKDERNKKLCLLAEESAKAFMEKQIGLTHKVLLETQTAENTWQGYSVNYTPFYVLGENLSQNSVLPVKAVGLSEDESHCIGEII